VRCRFLAAPPGGTPCRFCREADATQLAEPNRPAAPLQVPALPRETRCLDCDLNRNSQRPPASLGALRARVPQRGKRSSPKLPPATGASDDSPRPREATAAWTDVQECSPTRPLLLCMERSSPSRATLARAARRNQQRGSMEIRGFLGCHEAPGSCAWAQRAPGARLLPGHVRTATAVGGANGCSRAGRLIPSVRPSQHPPDR